MAFIGIRIDEATSLRVAASCDFLRQAGVEAEWVHPEDYHITLKFISGLSDDVAQKIILCLRENLESSAAFSIKLAEFKTFDRLGKPSVLWMSVLDPGKKFLSLAETVEKITTPLGIAPNREHYIPHLTVARFPASESNRLKCLLAILAAPNKEFVPMELQVRSVALMRRFQGKGQRADGPLYQSLGGIDLIT